MMLQSLKSCDILKAVKERVGASRIFSFGVGQVPNRYLLDRMAKLGRGAVAYLSLNDNAGEVMDAFFVRASHPAMADVEIDWGRMRVSEVYPERTPDLFVGRPVIVTGRFKGDGRTEVRVTGKAGGEARQIASRIKEVALEYGLMSQFTAFVAVDSTRRTAGDHGTTVAVPVPVPEGVRYETTVEE